MGKTNFLILIFMYEVILIILTMIVYADRQNDDNADKHYYGISSKRKLLYKKPLIDVFFDITIWGLTSIVIVLIGIILGEVSNIGKLYFMTEECIDNFGQIMFEAWIALVGFLIVLSSFSQESWLTFNANDIMGKYKIKESIYQMLIMVLIEGVLIFLNPVFDNLTVDFWVLGLKFYMIILLLFYFLKFVEVCYVIIESFLGTKMQAFFLDKLYQELWFFPVKSNDENEEWKNSDTILVETNYLINSYLSFSKKLDFNNLKEITYSSNIKFETNNIHEKKRNNIINKKGHKNFRRFSEIYIFINLGLYIWAIYREEVMNKGKGIIVDVVIIVILLIVPIIFGIVCYVNKDIKNSFWSTIIIIGFERTSYILKLKKGKKEYYKNVKEVPLFFPTTPIRFMQTLKSIIAFYLIAPEQKRNIIKDEICSQYQKGASELALPISIINFIDGYDDCLKKRNKEVIEYKKDIISKEDLWLINNCSLAICMDILTHCRQVSMQEFLKGGNLGV